MHIYTLNICVCLGKGSPKIGSIASTMVLFLECVLGGRSRLYRGEGQAEMRSYWSSGYLQILEIEVMFLFQYTSIF